MLKQMTRPTLNFNFLTLHLVKLVLVLILILIVIPKVNLTLRKLQHIQIFRRAYIARAWILVNICIYNSQNLLTITYYMACYCVNMALFIINIMLPDKYTAYNYKTSCYLNPVLYIQNKLQIIPITVSRY